MNNDNNGQNKLLILQLVILAIMVVFFFINRSSTDASFKNAYKDAETRLNNIEKQINTSQDLITKTKTQLDSIEVKVKGIKGGQKASNDAVAANNEELERKIKIQEARLQALTAKYNEVQKEKTALTKQLDSLAIRIQNDL